MYFLSWRLRSKCILCLHLGSNNISMCTFITPVTRSIDKRSQFNNIFSLIYPKSEHNLIKIFKKSISFIQLINYNFPIIQEIY
jgi:hypothetical protein